MKPSSIPGGVKVNSIKEKLFQGWYKSGQCPEATIPIRRSQEDEHPHPRAIHFKPSTTQLNHSFAAYHKNHEVSFSLKDWYFRIPYIHKQEILIILYTLN